MADDHARYFHILLADESEYIIKAVTKVGGFEMPELQIPDLDQKTMSFLRLWAADHDRTVEDEVRAEDTAILEETWNKGLARPKIAIVPLPEYESTNM